MLGESVKLISVDDHIIEPSHVWLDRLPKKYHDQAPHVIELENGREAWMYEDQMFPMESSTCRTLPEFPKPRPFDQLRYDEMRPGAYDPKKRLEEMDIDGVWAEIGFPTFPRFGGHRFLVGNDKELAHLCVRAWNDFVFEEWCAVDPARFIPLVIVPLWDVQLAAVEVRRVAELGARAIAFSENPTVIGLPSVHTSHWDPLWAAVQEADMAVCMHIGSSSKLITSSVDAPGAVTLSLVGVNSMVALADWLFSGALERFPRLRIVLSEGGAGWVPYILERAEHAYSLRSRHNDDPLTRAGVLRPPRQVYGEQVSVCMVLDKVALHNLDAIGVDNLMWEADYPHDDSAFPDSRRILAEGLRDIPSDVSEKIAWRNASEVFRFPV